MKCFQRRGRYENDHGRDHLKGAPRSRMDEIFSGSEDPTGGSTLEHLVDRGQIQELPIPSISRALYRVFKIFCNVIEIDGFVNQGFRTKSLAECVLKMIVCAEGGVKRGVGC